MVTGDGAREAAAEGRLIGGRYRLDRRLGSGGMGTVWVGHDLLVRREVAVKEAHTARDPARVERVLREARAAARVNHQAVVTVYDVVMEDGHPWIVMERVRGESLADRLDREGALPETEAARIALRVVEALAAAHARGVLHRDVKPGNVLLAEDGGVVLTDFGIAYIADEEPLTQAGEFVGSLAFTAPERMGGRHPEPASDLWSLGVLLFQMVEGWSPFQRESMEATVTAVVVDETPTLQRADTLAAVVAALLAKRPEERPSSADVVARLRAVVAPPESEPPAAERPAEMASSGEPAGAGAAEKGIVGGELEATPAGRPVAVAKPATVPRGKGAPEPEVQAPRPEASDAEASDTEGPAPEVPEAGTRLPGRVPPPTRARRLLSAMALCVLLGSLGIWALTHWNAEPGRSGTPGSASRGKASGPASSASQTTPTPTASTSRPATTAPKAPGYRLIRGSGFQAEVPDGWTGHRRNAQGQFRYTQGDFELVLVPGRDTAARFSAEPLTYQRNHEPELAPFRDASWASAAGIRLVETGRARVATGSFTWIDDRGREVFVGNAAILVAGRYHLVIVIGPEAKRDEVRAHHAHVLATYRPTA
ncbi:serine/threonine-protein kinase [Streptomyces exfoliatus]|uniref:serine/threonine-protein kinase n=1 Tax=Streptomyces exfoliatus TaxID=1905 RepID=UPI0004AC86EA|nr:serine/threonine-protein kinase [Streptomyces exfoliatus]